MQSCDTMNPATGRATTAQAKQQFSERLHHALDLSGQVRGYGRQADVSRMFDVSRETARRWLSGEAIPHTARIATMAKKLMVNGEWLLTGKGEPRVTMGGQLKATSYALSQTAANAEVKEPDSGELVRIPFLDVELGAGSAEAPDVVETRDYLQYPSGFLRDLGVNPERIRAVVVRGESMAPDLHDGDRLWIDIEDKQIQPGRIYAIYSPFAGLQVKRLQRRIDGTLIIQSANPDKSTYPDETLTPDQAASIHVIGRAIRKSGWLP